MVPENIRIKFQKIGRLRYVSHLDLCRAMTPAMIRAGIPIWYTEAFNPHPKMVFTQPLPLFAESTCEYLDIKITELMSFDEIKERLNRALAPELAVLDVYTPSEKFTEIFFANYEISGFEITNEMLDRAMCGEMEITKRTKSGAERVIDILPMVADAILEDGVIKCTLYAMGECYLNPDLFCKGLASKLSLGDVDYSIKRVGWERADRTEFK